MADAEVLRRLDRMVAILQLANHEAIEQARTRIRADELNAAILDTAAKRVGGGELVTAVQKALKGKPSPSTVKRRVASLVDQGALERTGAGPSTAYETTGLV